MFATYVKGAKKQKKGKKRKKTAASPATSPTISSRPAKEKRAQNSPRLDFSLDFEAVKTRVSRQEREFTGVKDEITGVKDQITGLRSSVGSMKHLMEDMTTNFVKIQSFFERQADESHDHGIVFARLELYLMLHCRLPTLGEEEKKSRRPDPGTENILSTTVY
jgi:archaellum component FlaC